MLTRCPFNRYAQAGTPHVKVVPSYNAAARTFTIKASQHTSPSPGQTDKSPVPIPIAVGLLGQDGTELQLTLQVRSCRSIEALHSTLLFNMCVLSADWQLWLQTGRVSRACDDKGVAADRDRAGVCAHRGAREASSLPAARLQRTCEDGGVFLEKPCLHIPAVTTLHCCNLFETTLLGQWRHSSWNDIL